MSDQSKSQEPASGSGAGEGAGSGASEHRASPFKVLLLFGLAVGLLYVVVGSLPHERVSSAVAWQTDLSEALKQGSASGKVIFADFYADWCGPCRQMDHDVFSDKQFATDLERTAVPLRVDLTTRAGQQVASRYGINEIPAYIVLAPDGNALGQSGGVRTAEQLLGMVQRAVERLQLTK